MSRSISSHQQWSIISASLLLFLLLMFFLSGRSNLSWATAEEIESESSLLAFTSGGTINFQGQLTDLNGTPLHGTYNLRFAIYNDATGGTKMWPSNSHEQHSAVPVNDGLFDVQLGSVGDAITPAVFNGSGNRYLQIWVCATVGSGCATYDNMGRLPISAGAYAQTLALPARLWYAPPSNVGNPVLDVRNTGDGYGIAGVAEGNSAGVLGESFGSGSWSYGVWGFTHGSSSRGVVGEANHISGTNYGVWGRSASTAGYGVFGTATATSGTNYGVWGQSSSTAGRGVFGGAYATSGTNYGVRGESSSTAGYGVLGGAFATSGTNYGVYGYTASSSGYAGYFAGRTHVAGTLSKSAGSFMIDHPLDPANKYLYHSFVESPDMMNIYNGNITLDENGEAWVQLPDWFEALNQDFRYQLTPIGGWAPLYIAQKVENNRFQIGGGEAGMEVSWQVTGIRHDPYAQENRIPVEVDKPVEERGTYLYPQGYDQPVELGRDYQDWLEEQDVPAVQEQTVPTPTGLEE